MDNNAKFSMQFSAKQVFLAGVAAGVLALGALGFAMMLAKGADASGWFTGSARVPAAPTQPSYPGAEPGDTGAGGVGVVSPVNDQDHLRGDKNAKVTIVEYSDFQCPYCKRGFDTIEANEQLGFHDDERDYREAAEMLKKL